MIAISRTIWMLSLLQLIMGCDKKHERTAINEELKLYSVDSAISEGFNGATCLVTVDIPKAGADAFLATTPIAPLNQTQVDQAAIVKTQTEIAKCAAGSKIKLQLMYHCGPKPLPGKPATDKSWSQQSTAEAVLKAIAAAASPVTKVYLSSCSSNDQQSVIAAAGTIAGIEFVITAGTTIELEPGNIKGAEYPNFQPQPVDIHVWMKEGDKLVDHLPPINCKKTEKFDINTNKCVPR